MSCRARVSGRISRSLAVGLFLWAAGAATSAAQTEPPRVRRIFIQGAEQISPSEVRKEMRLRQKVWWKPFQKNYLYGPDHLESDLTRILTLYHNEGFIFARIDEATVSYQSRDWVDIEIQVTEGARVYVAGAELVGPGGEDAARLREKIKIRPGEPLMEHLLARDENRLLEACHEMGRALAEVTRETRVREDSARVCYHVAVGPLVRLGEIDIAGLTRTKEQIVRRELVLKTGEIFRVSRAARTQERLYDLGLFRSVRIEPTYQERRRLTEPPREVEVDLTLDVVERPPGSYGFGLGYTSNDRIRLSGDWQYNNLGGRARLLRAQAEISYSFRDPPDQRFRRPEEWNLIFTYGAPWLLNTPTRWQLRSRYSFKRWSLTAPTPDEYIFEIGMFAGWELSRYLRLIGSLENRWTEQDSTGIDSKAYVTRRISLSLLEDRRDFILDPHKGHFAQFKSEHAGGLLGGQVSFVRWTASYSRYVPVGEGFTWAYRLRGGYVHPIGDNGQPPGTSRLDRIPYDDRFFAGGATTVRGYAERSLGPQTEGGTTGGTTSILLNIELRFSLFWKFGGAVFYDAGNVWADIRDLSWAHWFEGWTRSTYSELDAAHTLGFGVRFATPVGPVRLDYGRKMGRGARDHYKQDSELHFSLGQAF